MLRLSSLGGTPQRPSYKFTNADSMFEWAKNLIFAALLVSATNAFGDVISTVLSSAFFFVGLALGIYALTLKKELATVTSGYQKFSAAIVLIYVLVSFPSYLEKVLSLFS